MWNGVSYDKVDAETGQLHIKNRRVLLNSCLACRYENRALETDNVYLRRLGEVLVWSYSLHPRRDRCGCIELFDVYCHDITSPVVRRKKHRKTTSIVKDEEGTAFGSGAVGLRARMSQNEHGE